MTKLEEHAKQELERANLFSGGDYEGLIGNSVMELVKTLSSQGHSGMSHQITMEVFNIVANFKTLTSISSDPAEWNDVSQFSNDGNKLYQSNRNPEIFSKDGGKTWYNPFKRNEEDGA